jgi:hypothetical protein
MSMFGGLSPAQRNRLRVRVRTAMKAMAPEGRRYLGGRPRYGYREGKQCPSPILRLPTVGIAQVGARIDGDPVREVGTTELWLPAA